MSPRLFLTPPFPPHTQTLNSDPGPFLDPEARPSTQRPSPATKRDGPLPLQTGGGEFRRRQALRSWGDSRRKRLTAGCGAAADNTHGAHGLCPHPRRDPGALAAPPGLAASRPGQHVVVPSCAGPLGRAGARSGGAGRGAAAPRPSAEQRLGSRPRNHAPPPASLGSGSGAADPDPAAPKPTGAARWRLHARSQTPGAPGDH